MLSRDHTRDGEPRGFLTSLVGAIIGAVVGIFIGFTVLAIADPKGDPNAGMANLGLGLLLFFGAMILGVLGGSPLGAAVALKIKSYPFCFETFMWAVLMNAVPFLGMSTELGLGLVFVTPLAGPLLGRAITLGLSKRSFASRMAIFFSVAPLTLLLAWFIFSNIPNPDEERLLAREKETIESLDFEMYLPGYIPAGGPLLGSCISSCNGGSSRYRASLSLNNLDQPEWRIYIEQARVTESFQPPFNCGHPRPDLLSTRSLSAVPCKQVFVLPSGEPVYKVDPKPPDAQGDYYPEGALYLKRGSTLIVVDSSGDLPANEIRRLVSSFRRPADEELKRWI